MMRLDSSDGKLSRQAILWTWLVALCITLAPLLTVEILPLVDYPVHIVRQFILIHFKDMPALQAGYAIDWGIKPNLAMDIIVPILSRWIPLLDAGRLFAGLVLLMLVGSTCFLAKTLHGQVGPLPILSLLFLYNINFFEGYLNCLMSSSLMLASFAIWLRSDTWQPCIRILIIASMMVLMFFAHLFPLAIFGMTVIAYEIGRQGWIKRNLIRNLKILLLAGISVAILWILKPTGPEISNLDYGPPILRLHMWMGPALSLIYSDILILIVMLACPFLAILSVRDNPLVASMRLPILVLFIASFFIPQSILGGGAVHLRLPVLMTFMIIASISPNVLPEKKTRMFFVFVIVVLGLRAFDISRTWRTIDADYSEIRVASHAIQPGARILTLDEITKPTDKLIYSHATDLAVLERCVFVPHLAKIPDQQPIVPAKETKDIDGGLALPVNRIQFEQGIDSNDSEQLLRQKYPGWIRPYFANWPDHFDYVFHVHDKGVMQNPRPDLLSPVKTGSYFSIYRIKNRPAVDGLHCG